MGRWKSLDERLELGERAVYLHDEQKLRWGVIASRLGLTSDMQAIIYYRAYKVSLLVAKPGMTFRQIETFARQHKIEPGYLWLYENGFRKRVPMEVQEKIEDAKLSVFTSSTEEPRLQIEVKRRRGRPRKKELGPLLKEARNG